MFRPLGDGGKGDSPRPIKDREKFESNWDNIFRKKSNDAATTATGEEKAREGNEGEGKK